MVARRLRNICILIEQALKMQLFSDASWRLEGPLLHGVFFNYHVCDRSDPGRMRLTQSMGFEAKNTAPLSIGKGTAMMLESPAVYQSMTNI